MLGRSLKALILLGAVLGLAGCDLPQWAIDALFGPPPAVQFPGNFVAMGDNYYANSNISQLKNAISDAQDFSSVMQTQGGWTQNGFFSDCSITANSFASGAGIDAMYFQGHGLPGAAELCEAFQPNQSAANQAWGPCSSSGKIVAGNGSEIACPPHSTAGMPISGRLKWIFLNSSNSVAGPQSVDPNDPDWTASWQIAFGNGLHGLYGGWEAPDFTCTGQNPPNRSCDLQDGNGIGKYFAQSALPPSPGSTTQGAYIHDSWKSAARSAGADAGWSMWEDDWARDDIISGPSNNGVNPPTYASKLSGTLDVFYPTPEQAVVMQPMIVHPDTFALAPRQLQNEAIDHAALTQQYSSYINGASIKDNGNIYTVHGPMWTLQHWYGKSGAVLYSAATPQTTMAVAQTAAQQAAVQFVQDTFGVPSDAVLTAVLQEWEYQPHSGSLALTGYEFIWKHAGAIFGGDAIKVEVTDWRSAHQTCTQWGWSDPPVHKICVDWTTTYSDSPYVSYGYRLWRTLGGTSSIQPAGQVSIDAATAATALPAGALITNYEAGLWTPAVDESSSLGARSAWIFTLNGNTQVAVDAANGKILGAIKYQ